MGLGLFLSESAGLFPKEAAFWISYDHFCTFFWWGGFVFDLYLKLEGHCLKFLSKLDSKTAVGVLKCQYWVRSVLGVCLE